MGAWPASRHVQGAAEEAGKKGSRCTRGERDGAAAGADSRQGEGEEDGEREWRRRRGQETPLLSPAGGDGGLRGHGAPGAADGRKLAAEPQDKIRERRDIRELQEREEI